ncbi:MAG: OmpA family protein [Sorangiineae bacterium]|nr:OmpA family protein [Sorangiineae bacterium]
MSLRLKTFTSVAVLAAASSLLSSQARADGLPLDRFDPAPAGDRMFGVPSPFVAGHLRPHIAAYLDYARMPLVLRNTESGDKAGNVVSDQLFLHLNATLPLFDRLALSINVPFALAQAGDAPGQAGALPAVGGAELGELRAGLRLRLLGEYQDAFQLGLGGYAWFPTGDSDGYVGNGSVRGMPQLLLGGRTDRIVWSAAAGPQFRAGQSFANVSDGTQINVGAGIGFLLGSRKQFQVGPEAYAAFTVKSDEKAQHDDFARSSNLEVLLDGRWRVVDDVELGLGVGPGLTSGLGTPAFRGVLMVAYTPKIEKVAPGDRDGDGILDKDDACPDVAGVASDDPAKNGCPSDRDGDGILDKDDACPDVPGVKSDDPAKHGCPLPGDRDGDGILDKDDACPDVAVVENDDPAKNGCPPDRDGDGILDKDDACPDVPGVKSDDPAKHGCPPDTDGDGIPDDKDACPAEAGPADPDPKKNGCPTVHVTDKEIVILEQVQFDTNQATIKPVSNELLDKVAAVFRDHLEIQKVEVQGHTDNRGNPAYNKGLSQRRAAAVVAALVKRGIVGSRLVAKGYGQERPIADNSTDAGRQQNRRVQFQIIEKASKVDGQK